MPINIIANQSFGYFTKPPQSDQIGLYVRDGDGRISDAMITPQSKYQNFLGVSRRQRTQGPEYAMIARLVGSWTGLQPRCRKLRRGWVQAIGVRDKDSEPDTDHMW
ncbi:hypothetical protein [Mycobacteroides abscessus]|uniref:hypothetical protein n=1 Tax=Mycobacteroides abscessus TaxID=36809 RepID=UPI001054B549